MARRIKLIWQSKLVLLLVLPFAASDGLLQTRWWAANFWPVAVWSLGLSLLLGLTVFVLRAATPEAALSGAAITASLMYSTARFTPSEAFAYAPWHTALIPLLAVFLLTFISTRLGRERKEKLGTAEPRQGRSAAQVTANLGVAALVSSEFAHTWLSGAGWFARTGLASAPLWFAAATAALAEAAADTVSSEIGQIMGRRPRMITTLRRAETGTDGAITLAGTLAGVAAAGIVALAGSLALGGGKNLLAASWAGGVFGLLFDSLLGATVERRGWLNNDLVNFLSSGSAAAFALLLLAFG